MTGAIRPSEPRHGMLRASAMRIGRAFSARPVLRAAWPAGGAFLAALSGFFSDHTTATVIVGALIVAAVTLPVICEAVWDSRLNDDNDTIELRGRVLSRILATLLRTIAAAVGDSKAQREQSVTTTARQITQQLVDVFGADQHVRCTVYKLTDDQNKLVPVAHHGREDYPREFVRATPRGRKAIEWLLSDSPKPRFEPDTSSADQSKWEGTSDHYRTFVSVAIYSDDIRYGMLTIDAPNVGTLAESDSHLSQAFAAVMAVVFAEGRRGGKSRSNRRTKR